MSLGNILGQILQQGMSGQGRSRLDHAVGAGGIGDLLGGLLGGQSGQGGGSGAAGGGHYTAYGGHSVYQISPLRPEKYAQRGAGCGGGAYA